MEAHEDSEQSSAGASNPHGRGLRQLPNYQRTGHRRRTERNAQLRALLWCPQGKGPFPAILFNHGRGLTPHTEGRVAGITELGRVFAGHGYVFMALFRRGEDLSADQGVFIGDLLERNARRTGMKQRTNCN